MPSSHLILSHAFLLLLAIPPSIRVFSNESLFAWSGQSIGASALASFLPMNTQDWSPLGWTDWISLQSKGLSRVFSNTTVQKHHSLALSFLHSPTLTSYMTTGKTIALTRWTFVGKVMALLFNILSRLVINFLPKSKHLLISWLQYHLRWFWSPKEKKVWHCFHCFPICFPWSDRTGCHDLCFLNVEL